MKAVDDERGNMAKHDVWRNRDAKEWSSVKHPGARVIRLHLILGMKHVELGPDRIRWKCRIVGNGGDVKNWLDAPAEDFEELYTLPVSTAGVRLIAASSLLTDTWEVWQFDVDGAYLQCPRKPGDELWARIPAQYHDENMKKMRDPVVPLRKKVYGEKDGGDHYGEWMVDTLESLGWERTESDAGTVFRKPHASLGLYVDDGIMAGEPSVLGPALDAVAEKIDLESPQPLKEFLGIVFQRLALSHGRGILLQQKEYAEKIVRDFLADAGPGRRSPVPCVEFQASELANPEQERGELAGCCRKHVGAALFLARQSRHIAYATGAVAREIANWTTASDQRLKRLFS